MTTRLHLTLEQWRGQPDADKDVWLAADADRQERVRALVAREDVKEQLVLLPAFLALMDEGVMRPMGYNQVSVPLGGQHAQQVRAEVHR